MVTLKNIFLLLIIKNLLLLTTAQWCVKYEHSTKTRLQWNNGQRMTTKRGFFGNIKYKYEPYIYSTTQYYTDYERISVCCDGYRKISDVQCEPICEPGCPTNTHCARPNICECNDGYRGYTTSANLIKCSPSCQPTCSENSQCIAPNKCSCNDGYKDNGYGICEPECLKNCPENSKCTKPNECTCNQGYLDNGLGICQPFCQEECPENSKCSKPEECLCFEGYQMLEDKCEAICENKCPENSKCILPNQCECMDGYEKIIELENFSFQCKAKCVEECPLNAYCHKPNECVCIEGYKKSESGLCEPICEPECFENSMCVEPNKCSCLKGYDMIDQHCQPICDRPCPENSSCKQPNKCECEAGYQLKLTSIYNLYCEPICQSNCSAFGKCVQPNKCECLKGYEMDEMEVCQPVCQACQNGLCFQPDVCICKPGYLMGPNDVCEPACSMHCQNGSCIEPEICQCHEGFQFKEGSINVCEPKCQPLCINGICAGPNICICHENYEPLETEFGLNHSNCQERSTTTELYTSTSDVTTIMENLIETTMEKEIEKSTTLEDHTLHPAQLFDTTLSSHPNSLGPSELCSELCQCWQEYDEFGPLTSQQCIHTCVDNFDKPCLNLTLCTCDITNTQLICPTSEDSLEQHDPLLFICKIQQLRATTSKSINMKSIDSKSSNLPWILGIIVVVLVATAAVGVIFYKRFKRQEDLILEYEL